MFDPILVTLLKMRPHYSQSSRENATPSSGTSPLASWATVSVPECNHAEKSHTCQFFALFLPAIFAGPRFVGIHKFCYTGKMITINKFRTCTVLTSYTYLRRGQCKLKTYQEMASLYHKWIFPLVHCLTGSPGQCQDDRQQLPPLEARTRARNRS